MAKAQTRSRVRDAARALFLRHGFTDTTVQMVAEHAGVAVGTVFQHASDKDDLLLLVVHEPLAAALKRVSTCRSSGEVLTDLTAMFGTLMEIYVEFGPAARPAVRAQWFGGGPNARGVRWLHETFLERVVVRLEQAQAAGSLSDGAEVRVLAANLSSRYEGVLLGWLRTDDGVDAAIARLRAAFALQIIPLQTTAPEAPASAGPRA